MSRSVRSRRDRISRGIALLEALVALTVMGFGTLAVLGVQHSLRQAGDMARQRSEALSLARQAAQDERTWATSDDYRDIATLPDEVVAAANTSFTVRRTVVDLATDENQPRRKTLTVGVTWQDRSGQDQTVNISTVLQAAEPVIAASLVVSAEASVTRNPGGRHRAVPVGSYSFGEGRSRFDPPHSGGGGWVFNNLSGFIEKVCVGPELESCTPLDARLLSGFVRFATVAEASPPSALDAESPPGMALPVDVVVSTVATGDMGCTEWADAGAIAYACAVPVDAGSVWSGRSEVFERVPSTLPLAASRADASALRYRVCRYTPYRDSHPVVPGGMRNAEHPLDYVDVGTALLNQNFLVIRAGDETTAYDCPADGPAEFANTNTWHHQPPT